MLPVPDAVSAIDNVLKSQANRTLFWIRGHKTHLVLPGVLLFSIGVLFESMMDAVAKLASTSYPLPQILLFRCVFGLFPLLLLVAILNSYSVSTLFYKSRLQVLRAALFGLVFCLYVYSLKYLAMVTAIALFLTLPFFMLMVSSAFHNEKVTIKNMFSTLGGFIGVILIMQPDFSDYGLVMLMPIVAAILTAFSLSISKSLSGELDPVSININSTIILFFASLPFALFAWEPVQTGDWITLSLVGIFGGVAILAYTAAVGISKMSLLAPFQYFSVVWAALFGWMIWADAPTLVAIFGIALIVISGIAMTLLQAD